jgi:hypothetical protein
MHVTQAFNQGYNTSRYLLKKLLRNQITEMPSGYIQA